MSSQLIDEYLAALDEPKRSTLEHLRRSILAVVPDAEQTISYGMPAFKLRGEAFVNKDGVDTLVTECEFLATLAKDTQE